MSLSRDTLFILRAPFEDREMEGTWFCTACATMEGALLTYLLVPGGTMFADRVPQLSATKVPVAKRGNLLFVRGGHVFVISTELAERVIEGKSYSKTTAEEDELLRTRLLDMLSKISFAKLPATDAAKK